MLFIPKWDPANILGRMASTQLPAPGWPGPTKVTSRAGQCGQGLALWMSSFSSWDGEQPSDAESVTIWRGVSFGTPTVKEAGAQSH